MNIDRIKNINKQYLDNSIKSNKDIKVEKRDDIINIEISDTAKAIINRINQSKDSGISERVEVIRQAIISGNYKVSSEEIADKIINILESKGLWYWMMAEKGLNNHLKIIYNLLIKERVALINNDVGKISEIVEQKNEQIEELKKYKGVGIKNFEEVANLIEEINSMQELNLLLTNQALSYQNALLESISHSVNNIINTYSSNGKYETKNNMSIIDQSV